jgi:hypothetical protein
MKVIVGISMFTSLFLVALAAPAEGSVFFEEQFTGPNLDSAAWRTEILTSGPRFCNDTTAPWAPGHWVDEGEECHAVAAYSPYGSAILSDGSLHLSSSNVRAFPVLLSRLPGAVPQFPTSGDFMLTVRMRYDRVTPWGVGLEVFQAQTTEPIGDNRPCGLPEDVLLQVWCDDPAGGITVYTAIGGSFHWVADVSPATEFVTTQVASRGGMPPE